MSAGAVAVGEGPRAARAERRVAAHEEEREQRRGEQQEHEGHDERVAVQSCAPQPQWPRRSFRRDATRATRESRLVLRGASASASATSAQAATPACER